MAINCYSNLETVAFVFEGSSSILVLHRLKSRDTRLGLMQSKAGEKSGRG